MNKNGDCVVEIYAMPNKNILENEELVNAFAQAARAEPEAQMLIEEKLEELIKQSMTHLEGKAFQCVVDQANEILREHSKGKDWYKEYLYERNDQLPTVKIFDVVQTRDEVLSDIYDVFRKYKPVDKKVHPVKATLPQEFHVKRQIIGDPLEGMPILPVHLPEFTLGERYTQERKDIIDKNHLEGFLWSEERKLLHELMKLQEMVFAWNAAEGGNFRMDFFPPVKFPVLLHVPWVERNISIPLGIYKKVCGIIKDKIDAEVYEPPSSSYQLKWFCVLKKV
ncbi:hypothetical protein Moror_3730 [Moniliophthora roreri MCA 2997]|uniref:Uncharacterized protein n=1 Tax=Moniliophthora roreri (strain MCA 2997) TaxID=1381753 RepID=V2WLE2_MONRO|nr:hypothetical protein Moror_3730 [Moniliophthora roreri MCA 2997]